jgi:signal transduction histidine kinase
MAEKTQNHQNMIFQGALRKIRSLFSGGSNGYAEEMEVLKEKVRLLEHLIQQKDGSIERVKSFFLRNLYHEIRTPLNAIIGFSDLIEANNINREEKETYIQYIRESSRDFLNKMDNIIEASIIEAGMLKINSEPCFIYELVNEVYAYFSLHKHIAERNIAFLLNVPKNLHKVQILCDSYRITQILTNLLSNAFKFTSHGVIELGFSIINDDVQFYVRDTGIGGLKGKEDNIFRNFTKIDNSESSLEGLGLGLGLAKNIIDKMEGKIWFESEESKGTTFYFSIPYKPVYVTKLSRKAEKNNIISLVRVLKRSVVL